MLKYAANTGAQAIAGRFTPGSFTNYITRSFKEPRLIVVTDPRVDHQAIREASYVNIPVIAFCDTDAPLKFVDVAIPTNNKSRHSIGLMWWLLAREVLRLRGTIPRTPDGWNVMVDMFFYRDPEEVEKQQQEEAAAKAGATAGETAEAPINEWDPTGAPAAGGINPALAAGDGGALCVTQCGSAAHFASATRSDRLVCGADGGWHDGLVSRAGCGIRVGCGRLGRCVWLGLRSYAGLLLSPRYSYAGSKPRFVCARMFSLSAFQNYEALTILSIYSQRKQAAVGADVCIIRVISIYGFLQGSHYAAAVSYRCWLYISRGYLRVGAHDSFCTTMPPVIL